MKLASSLSYLEVPCMQWSPALTIGTKPAMYMIRGAYGLENHAIIHHVSKSHTKNGGAMMEMLTSCKNDMKEFDGNNWGCKALNSLHVDKKCSGCRLFFSCRLLIQSFTIIWLPLTARSLVFQLNHFDIWQTQWMSMSRSHKIHGTGIFTYMNGMDLCHSCR